LSGKHRGAARGQQTVRTEDPRYAMGNRKAANQGTESQQEKAQEQENNVELMPVYYRVQKNQDYAASSCYCRTKEDMLQAGTEERRWQREEVRQRPAQGRNEVEVGSIELRL